MFLYVSTIRYTLYFMYSDQLTALVFGFYFLLDFFSLISFVIDLGTLKLALFLKDIILEVYLKLLPKTTINTHKDTLIYL